MLLSKKTLTLIVVLVAGYFVYMQVMKKKNGMNGTATNGTGASA